MTALAKPRTAFDAAKDASKRFVDDTNGFAATTFVSRGKLVFSSLMFHIYLFLFCLFFLSFFLSENHEAQQFA